MTLKADDTAVELDGTDITVLLAESASFEAVRDSAQKELDKRQDRIRELLGEATVGTVKGVPVVTNRWRNRTTLDGKALKALDAKLWEKVASVTRYRVLDRKLGKKPRRVHVK